MESEGVAFQACTVREPQWNAPEEGGGEHPLLGRACPGLARTKLEHGQRVADEKKCLEHVSQQLPQDLGCAGLVERGERGRSRLELWHEVTDDRVRGAT